MYVSILIYFFFLLQIHPQLYQKWIYLSSALLFSPMVPQIFQLLTCCQGKPQKTMHTLMSFRLSNMMHHLQQNSPSEMEGVTSSYGCIVLDGCDSAKGKHLNPQCPPESRHEFPWNTMVQFLKASALHWFQCPNYLHFIWRDAYVSALQLSYSLPARGWHWHCLSRTTTLWTSWIVRIYKYVFDYWGQCVM